MYNFKPGDQVAIVIRHTEYRGTRTVSAVRKTHVVLDDESKWRHYGIPYPLPKGGPARRIVPLTREVAAAMEEQARRARMHHMILDIERLWLCEGDRLSCDDVQSLAPHAEAIIRLLRDQRSSRG